MTTAIDTNVLVALWNEDDRLNPLARSALDAALEHGGLVISAPVFAELLAAPVAERSVSGFVLRRNGDIRGMGIGRGRVASGGAGISGLCQPAASAAGFPDRAGSWLILSLGRTRCNEGTGCSRWMTACIARPSRGFLS